MMKLESLSKEELVHVINTTLFCDKADLIIAGLEFRHKKEFNRYQELTDEANKCFELSRSTIQPFVDSKSKIPTDLFEQSQAEFKKYLQLNALAEKHYKASNRCFEQIDKVLKGDYER